jgi:hypothetical protein
MAMAIQAIQSPVDVYTRQQGVLNEAYDNLRRLDEDNNYHRGMMHDYQTEWLTYVTSTTFERSVSTRRTIRCQRAGACYRRGSMPWSCNWIKGGSGLLHATRQHRANADRVTQILDRWVAAPLLQVEQAEHPHPRRLLARQRVLACRQAVPLREAAKLHSAT